jgi:hypothetical protein
MHNTALAIIRIGGRLEESQAPKLITAITAAQVFAHQGDIYFEPRSASDLVAARIPAGFLELTDDEAELGEMPGIVAACKELGLPYRLWSEAVGDAGAEVTTWAPGMDHPLIVTGDNYDHETFLVRGPAVQRALALLEAGQVHEATEALKAILPDIPEMPPFEIIEAVEVTAPPETAHVTG